MLIAWRNSSPESVAKWIADIDELVAVGAVESRSEAVRIGLHRIVDEHRRQDATAIVAGYEAGPKERTELGWPDKATIAVINDELW